MWPFSKMLKPKSLFFNILEKGNILWPFSGIAPTKMKLLSKNIYIYMYIIYICSCDHLKFKYILHYNTLM